MRYFGDGLYFHGGMGKVVRTVQRAAAWLGMSGQLAAVAAAPTLEEQRAAWARVWLVRMLRAMPAWLLSLFADFAGESHVPLAADAQEALHRQAMQTTALCPPAPLPRLAVQRCSVSIELLSGSAAASPGSSTR